MADTATGDRLPKPPGFALTTPEPRPTETDMTDLTLTAARDFNATTGFAPQGLLAGLRHLPLLVATALLSVAIISLF